MTITYRVIPYCICICICIVHSHVYVTIGNGDRTNTLYLNVYRPVVPVGE